MPNVLTYNSAIKASGDGGEGQLEVQMLLETLQEWLAPNAVTYNSALKVSGDGGGW